MSLMSVSEVFPQASWSIYDEISLALLSELHLDHGVILGSKMAKRPENRRHHQHLLSVPACL